MMQAITANLMRRCVLGSLWLGLAACGTAATALPASAAAKITSCPFVISRPGRYVLAQDLTCAGDGITILADDVHLTLADFTLTDANTGAGVGIRIRCTAADPITGVRGNGGVVRKPFQRQSHRHRPLVAGPHRARIPPRDPD